MSSVRTPAVSRRGFLRLGAVSAAAAWLVGCQPAAQTGDSGAAPAAEKTSVLVTINHSLTVYDPLAYDMARERMPEVELTVDQTPSTGGWDIYADNVITRIAGGERLDILYMAVEGLRLIADKGVIVPLDDFLDADAEAKADIESDVHPRLREVLSWRDSLYLFPFGWNNMLCWYNPKILADLGVAEPQDPWTMADFVALCQEVADVTGSGTDRYAYSWTDNAFGMSPWYFNHDTSWLKNDWSDSNLDDPKVAETLQLLADLIHEYKVSPQLAGWDEPGQFHSGNLVMRGCGRWCVGQAKTAEFTDYNFEYYPHEAGPFKTVVGVGGWGIVGQSGHPEVSWEVVANILGTPEVLTSFINVAGSVPSRRSVAETEVFLSGPEGVDMSIFYESLDHADVVPSPPNFNLIDPLLKRWYGQLWSGDITVDELVVGAHAELQAEMDKIKEA